AGEHTGFVVVHDHAGGACLDGGVVLLGEGALTANDQRGLSLGVVLELITLGQAGPAQVDQLIGLAGGRWFLGVVHRHERNVLTAGHGPCGGGHDVAVVVGGDPDDVFSQARCSGGVHTGITLVADGGDDDHACVDEVVGCGRGAVLRPGVGWADAHGEQGQGLFHGGDHDVRVGGAGAAEDLVGTDLDAGCHTGHFTLGPDDPGHVRAVAVAVLWVLVRFGDVAVGVARVEVVTDEVVPGDHAFVGKVPTAQVRVGVVHTGVHDGHTQVLPGEAEFVLCDVGTGHGQGGVEVGNVLLDLGDLVPNDGMDGG